MQKYMQKTLKKRSTRDLLAKLGLGALIFGMTFASPSAFAQQNPPNQDNPAQPQDQQPPPPDQTQMPDQNANPPQDQATPPDQNAPQNQNPQDQMAPPPQDQGAPQDQQNGGQDQGPMNPPPNDGNNSNGNPPPNGPNRVERRPPPLAPPSLTLPAGSVIQIRTTDFLSSDKNHKGDSFIATLAQPIVIDGWVVMRRGQTITGQVTDAVRAGRVKGVSKLQLDLSQLTLVDGQLLPVQTQLLNASAGTSKGRDAAAIGLTTGTGAAIGAAAAGGPGAAIGAGAGFVASVTGVLVTRGKPTIITPETLLTFKLEQPVSFSTVRGLLAFRPVSQADYAPQPRNVNGRPMLRRPYPYPYPYGYYYGPGYPPPYPIGYYPGPGY
jgi:hypothetical protein